MVSRNFTELSLARATRAQELAGIFPESREPLLFFAEVTAFQADLGKLEPGWEELAELLPRLAELIGRIGTDPMKAVTQKMNESRLRTHLMDYWMRRNTAGLESLFARILLQPFAFGRAAGDGTPEVYPPENASQFCSHCYQAPQVGILRDEGAGKSLVLVCSLCLNEWSGPRNRCTSCGGGGGQVLEYFSAKEFSGRVLQCCRTCRRYLHLIEPDDPSSIVAPDADEIAGISLDVWAVGQGLVKQQQNLAGI